MYGFYGEQLRVPEEEKISISKLLGALLRRSIEQGPKLPKVLYHYTSAAGLKGMVEAGRVRATHVGYMNDTSEYWIGIRALLELIGSAKAPSNELRLLFEEMKPRLAGTRPFYFYPAFVACFSAAQNDLNQWRAYSGGTGGYCLGFNGQKLWDKAYGLGGFMAPVTYNKDSARKLVSDFLDAACQEYLRVSGNHHGPAKDSHRLEWVTTLFALTSPLLPVLKDPSFHDEQEWRIVYPLRFTTEVGTTPRARSNILCPYVDLRLGEKNDHPKSWPENSPGRMRPLPDRLPLTEVLAGPGEHEELGYISARALLECNGYDGVTVGQSLLPYRTTSI